MQVGSSFVPLITQNANGANGFKNRDRMVKINYFFLKKYIYPTFLDNAPPLLSQQRRVARSHPARVARYLRPSFKAWLCAVEEYGELSFF